MNEQGAASSASQVLSEALIVDWLRTRPDFFNHQPALLAELKLPHDSGAAISLVQRQVEVLRERTRQYAAGLDEVVRNAARNQQIHDRLHELAASLLGCTNRAEVLACLETGLGEGFGADSVSFHLQASADVLALVDSDSEGQPQARCLHAAEAASTPAAALLMPDTGSAALVPLGTPPSGLIVLCSADIQHFSPELGVEFLNRLGALASAALRVHAS